MSENAEYKVAIYSRCATAEQLSGEKITALYCRSAQVCDPAVNTQEYQLRKYAAEAGCENISLYIDNGESGLTLERPAFQEMMSGIKKGAIGCVIVKSIDRISRNYAQYGKWLYDMLKKGIRVISINEGYDSANPDDTLHEWFAEVDKRCKEAFPAKIKMGIAHARQRRLEQAQREQNMTVSQ